MISVKKFFLLGNFDFYYFFFFLKVNRLESEGYYGGVRLLMAICKVFYKYCAENGIVLKDGNFTLSYDTNIPRQVFFFFLLFSRKFFELVDISLCSYRIK